MNQATRAWAILLAAVGATLVAKTLSAQNPAVMSIGGSAIEWRATIETGGLVLTVSGPGGVVTSRAFEGSTASFPLFTPDGQLRSDGLYTYELQIAPRLSPELRRELETARTGGEASPPLPAGLPKGAVQSGSFVVRGGAFVLPSLETVRSSTNTTAATVEPQTVVTPDNEVIQGSLCVGGGCGAGEAFGSDTIRLKAGDIRIRFDDTSFLPSLPDNDWQLTINESTLLGVDKFSIEDLTGGTVPFTIQGGADTNAIYVDPSGRVGFRTSTPAADLHVSKGDTPTLRFEQNATSGFRPLTWEVAGNEGLFFVRNVTDNHTPLLVSSGPSSARLHLGVNGRVTIGSGAGFPPAQLHLAGAETQDVFAGMGIHLGSGPAFTFGYAGASIGRSAGFFNVRPDASAVAPNPSLRFATANVQRMILDNEGFLGLGVANPSHPLELASGAFVSAGGVWTNASSRELKQDIRELSSVEAMDALRGLTPVRLAYKADSSEKHMGFIAEDVPALVATPGRRGLSPMDVVAVLTRVVQEQQRLAQEQQNTIHVLIERLGTLEAQSRER